MRKLHIGDIDVSDGRILTRVDFNVPLAGGLVTDDIRIRRALPTIRHIVEAGGVAVLMSHLGRPEGQIVEDLRLQPVAVRLSELLGREVSVTSDCVGEETESLVGSLRRGGVVLLENLRFHAGETKNDAEFARRLARLGDVYVSDAFGTAHRAHASTVGAAGHFETRAMGYLMESEVANLTRVTEDPQKPLVAILGGAKVSDKIGVIENLMPKVDGFLVGGGMAFTFLRARGISVGDSLVEEDRVDTARALLDRAGTDGKTFLLPVDVVVARNTSAGGETKTVAADAIEEGWRGLDIGPKTARAFSVEVATARTIVWNGPLGVFEDPRFAAGTTLVALAVAESTEGGAFSVVGGGDSAAAMASAGVADRITHISTGGGASLEFLEGKELPGIAALSDAPRADSGSS